MYEKQRYFFLTPASDSCCCISFSLKLLAPLFPKIDWRLWVSGPEMTPRSVGYFFPVQVRGLCEPEAGAAGQASESLVTISWSCWHMKLQWRSHVGQIQTQFLLCRVGWANKLYQGLSTEAFKKMEPLLWAHGSRPLPPALTLHHHHQYIVWASGWHRWRWSYNIQAQ